MNSHGLGEGGGRGGGGSAGMDGENRNGKPLCDKRDNNFVLI